MKFSQFKEKTDFILLWNLTLLQNQAHYPVRHYDRFFFQFQVYVYLLQMLIKPQENLLVGVQPPAPPQPDVEMALTLLEGNATKIPPEKALPILPKDIPVRRIKHYLTVSLSEHLNLKRKSQISRGLQYAEHLQVSDCGRNIDSSESRLTTGRKVFEYNST